MIGAAPRISVIMAVFNGARWLAQTMDSVQAQTYTDYEFLIHDDGSTDGSLDILKSYATCDSRISVSTGSNAGSAAARNTAIARARGEFLALIDAEDLCYPERFSRQVAYLDANPDVSVLGSRVRVIDEAGRPVHYSGEPEDHDAIDARNMEGHTALVQPSVMMRRSAFEAVGGYDESFRNAQDLELWLRMGEKFRLANCPEVLLDYRFQPFSVSAGSDGDPTNNNRARLLAARRRGIAEADIKLREPWSWRPAPDPKSQSDFSLYWAARAHNSGFNKTARYYYLQAIKLRPFSPRPWKKLVGAFLRDPRIFG